MVKYMLYAYFHIVRLQKHIQICISDILNESWKAKIISYRYGSHIDRPYPIHLPAFFRNMHNAHKQLTSIELLVLCSVYRTYMRYKYSTQRNSLSLSNTSSHNKLQRPKKLILTCYHAFLASAFIYILCFPLLFFIRSFQHTFLIFVIIICLAHFDLVRFRLHVQVFVWYSFCFSFFFVFFFLR